jgi:hypothetical protein
MTKSTRGHRALLPAAEVRWHFASNVAESQYAMLILAVEMEGSGAEKRGTGSRRSKRYCWLRSAMFGMGEPQKRAAARACDWSGKF